MRTLRPMNRYPTPAQVLRLVIFAAFLAPLLVGQVFSLHSQQLGLLAAELSILWLMALFIRRHRMVPEDLLLLNATPPSALLASALTALCASLLIADFDLLCSKLLSFMDLHIPLGMQQMILEIQLVRDLPDLLLVLATVVLAPGLCEELFFRGLIFTGLYIHRGPRTAVLGTALLFALIHLRPWQLPALFLFGFFLAALVYWTHSIYPAILAHIINNLVSVGSVNLKIYLGPETLGAGHFLPLPITALALVILIAGLRFLHRLPPLLPLHPPLATAEPRPVSDTSFSNSI